MSTQNGSLDLDGLYERIVKAKEAISEYMQKTGSFKVRGALNAISTLSEEQKQKGVIAASSGNHAQAVAFSSTRLGIPSTIVMPKATPIAKIEATKGYGATVIIHGETFDDALAYAKDIGQKDGKYFVHPFNDLNIVAGQGTIGLEIVEDFPDVDVLIVPIGGGGLSTGIATVLKRHNPSVKIIGVQAETCNSMQVSMKEGKVTGPDAIQTICDGISVKRPGDITFPLAQKLIDEVVSVNDFFVSEAVYLMLERNKSVCEPSGAIGIAALLAKKIDVTGKKVCVVISGGNIDMSLLSRLVHQQLFNHRKRAIVRGEILDKSGHLNEVLVRVASAGLKVLSVNLDRFNPRLNPCKASLELEVEIPNSNALKEFLDDVKSKMDTYFVEHINQ